MSDYIVFDVETPNARNDRICSIGVTLIDDDRITETKNCLVNPETDFDAMNISVHGITLADVENAPPFPEIWAELRKLFVERVVVAHNASFDLNVLKKTLLHYGVVEDSIRYVDTLAMSKWVYPQFTRHGLNVLCDEFGIPLSHHNSGSDSQACAALLRKMIVEGTPVEKFIKAFDLATYIGSSTNSQPRRKLSGTSNALLELKEIIESIAEDGLIEEQEFELLVSWVNSHEELKGNYPYDKIYKTLYKICEDGIVTQCEIKELLTTLYSLIDPLKGSECTNDCQCICGKTICLSGEFLHGSKDYISNVLIENGAAIHSSVSRKTNIVLVGDCGSDAWLAGNYGTKIKKAMELQEKGIEIIIMKEKDLFAIIDGQKEGDSL